MIWQVVRRMKKVHQVTFWGIELLSLGGESKDRSERGQPQCVPAKQKVPASRS
jgi:hypothetical protein